MQIVVVEVIAIVIVVIPVPPATVTVTSLPKLIIDFRLLDRHPQTARGALHPFQRPLPFVPVVGPFVTIAHFCPRQSRRTNKEAASWRTWASCKHICTCVDAYWPQCGSLLWAHVLLRLPSKTLHPPACIGATSHLNIYTCIESQPILTYISDTHPT